MSNLMEMEDREIKKDKKEDSKAKSDSKRIIEFRERISDEAYIEHAINRIATDLSHYLTK